MLLKLILFLKHLLNKEFYCCNYICKGIKFFLNNILKICRFSESNEIDIYKISDNKKINYNILQRNRKKIFNSVKNGNIPQRCKTCPSLEKKSWKFSKLINLITLNYYVFYNLKCSHCRYLKNVKFNSNDTKDRLVLDTIKYLEKKSIISEGYSVDIGAGEPSINNKLDEIINYLVQKGHVVHINTNLAKYKENYVEGIKSGLILPTLNPDAGSREVYIKIKGADYFDIVKENMKKYMDAASNVIEVKFILEKGDVENKIKLCLDCGVKNVVCSFGLNINKTDYGFYKPYFIKFKELCEKYNLMLSYKFIPKEFLEVTK